MAKTNKAPIIIVLTTALLLGGLCTGMAIWATKQEKALADTTDYSLEKDRQLIVGTYKSFEDLPVMLTVQMSGYDANRKTDKKTLASDEDMKAKEGQNANAVWCDLSDWAQKFLGTSESFTQFFKNGGTVTVATACHNGDINSSTMQLTHSGVWFVGLPEKDGEAPVVTRADVIYQ